MDKDINKDEIVIYRLAADLKAFIILVLIF